MVIIYIMAFIVITSERYDSALIASIALIGLCSWLYRVRIGLLSIIAFLLLNTLILYFASGDLYFILQSFNPSGIILSIISALIIGLIRESQDKLDEFKSTLALRVDKATTELDKLTQQLIEDDEKERIRIGQDIHDGVGQYLTGMLLYSEALSLKLKEAQHSETGLAERMTQRIQKCMQNIRKLSRSQLPLQFTEMTFKATLEEMIEYFSEVSLTTFHMEYEGDDLNMPTSTTQNLFRIIHETIYSSISKYKAKNIKIKLTTKEDHCLISIKATNFPSNTPSLNEITSKIMQYRLRTINGNSTFHTLPNGGFRKEYSIDLKKGKK